MSKIPADPRLMTDADVARMLGVSERTVRERVKSPRKGEINLTLAEPQRWGGRRFWVRERVERLIGLVPASELLAALKHAKSKGVTK